MTRNEILERIRGRQQQLGDLAYAIHCQPWRLIRNAHRRQEIRALIAADEADFAELERRRAIRARRAAAIVRKLDTLG